MQEKVGGQMLQDHRRFINFEIGGLIFKNEGCNHLPKSRLVMNQLGDYE